MEAILNQPTTYTDEQKKELSAFKKLLNLFLAGAICLSISTLSFATSINGVPGWISLFAIFLPIAYVLFFIGLMFVRKLNKYFFFSLLSLCLHCLLMFIVDLCKSNTNEFYIALGKGLEWSADIMFAITLLLFFYGTYLIFDKYHFLTGKKRALIGAIIFVILYILMDVCDYFTGTKMVMSNILARRIFLYSFWGFTFLLYVFTLSMVISANHYLKIKYKKEGLEDVK